MGALQEKVDDVGEPEHVEDASDTEEYHGVAPVRPMARVVPPFTGFHLLAWKASPPLTNFTIMLLTDAENVKIGEADHKGSWSVQEAHHKTSKEGRGRPGIGTPLKDVPMVPRLPPAKKGWEEHNTRVDPDQDDAAAQTTGCHQLVVREGLGDGQVPVHAYAGQAGHGDTLENRDDVAKHLTREGFLDTSWVVQQGECGHQAAQSHQQVSVGHGLYEVAGGVVMQQRGTMKHKDDSQVPSND